MRRAHVIALGMLAAVAVVAGANVESCGSEPSPSRRAPRRANPRRSWSRSLWIAPARSDGPIEADAAVANADPYDTEDAGLEPVRPDLMEQLCRPLVHAICAARGRCGCPDAGCAERELASCASWLGCAYYGTGEGLVIDEERAARCVDVAGAASAQCLGFPLPFECYGVLVDPAEPGGACGEASLACVGGWCVEGRCEPTPREGESCEGECSGGAVCVDGRCRSMHGQACETLYDCPRWLACVGGRCAPPRPEHAACESDDECGVRFSCVEARCERPERCRVHEDCGGDDHCEGAHEDRCVAEPHARAGEPCDALRCAPGHVCRDGSCVEGPREREPCSSDFECAAGLSCEWNGSAHECVALDLREGEACPRSGGVCGPGLVCGVTSARCVRAASAGERCGDGCELGLACEELFDGGRCMPEICDDEYTARWSCDVD